MNAPIAIEKPISSKSIEKPNATDTDTKNNNSGSFAANLNTLGNKSLDEKNAKSIIKNPLIKEYNRLENEKSFKPCYIGMPVKFNDRKVDEIATLYLSDGEKKKLRESYQILKDSEERLLDSYFPLTD